MAGMARALTEVLVWSAVTAAVWLATLSSVTLSELCFAVAAGIACGILARAGRRSLGAAWRFRWRWLTWPVLVGTAAVVQSFQLWATTVRERPSGTLTEVQLPSEDPLLAAGRRAAAILALTATPGSVVAASDPGRHRLAVHAVVDAGPDIASLVSR